MSTRFVLDNVLRTIASMAPAACLLSAVAIGPSGLVLVPAAYAPGLIVSNLVVVAIPRHWRRAAARIAVMTASTVVSYLAIALVQQLANGDSGPRPGLSYWSFEWAVTALGTLTGLLFGTIATLPAEALTVDCPTR